MQGFPIPPTRLLLAIIATTMTAGVGVRHAQAGCGDYVLVGELSEAAFAAHGRQRLLPEGSLLLPDDSTVPPALDALTMALYITRDGDVAGRSLPAPCRGLHCEAQDSAPPQPVPGSVSRSNERTASAACASPPARSHAPRWVATGEPRLHAVQTTETLLRPPELVQAF